MSNPTTFVGDRQALMSLSKIGKQVWVKIDDDNHNEVQEFLQGEIIKVEMRKEEYDESIVIEHLIALDGGKEKWFNLLKMEEEGQVVWENPTVTMPKPAKEESSSSSDNDNEDKQEQKRNIDDTDNNAKKKKARVAMKAEEEQVNNEMAIEEEEEEGIQEIISMRQKLSPLTAKQRNGSMNWV